MLAGDILSSQSPCSLFHELQKKICIRMLCQSRDEQIPVAWIHAEGSMVTQELVPPHGVGP